jgi:FlaA1/EpsC-like NDP-sugar epimerase
MLGELLASKQVDEVFVAMSNPTSGSLNQCLTECRRHRIPVYAFPTLQNVLEGKTLLKMEEIRLEDLLRRQPFRADLAEIGGYLTDKRVLVTGAGGSIGSELCRQIAAMNPATLLLMGHGENSIDRINRELCTKFAGLANRLQMVIASVSDARRVEEVISRYRPQVVFHAAAHKHVPIMQVNVGEAIRNNVLGTHHVAEACGRHGVETMVLISTDKAVYPSNVMGATKWICEQLLCAMSLVHGGTKYVTVRFGNVLGSRGSVVPIFEEQIARKGPVTVTHDEMTRYFMTIPEAVQLVLQAGASGRSGDLFLLDMGLPVRIMDLAEDMIRLHGYTREDIPIIITGTREGEKLHEKLVMEDEELVRAGDGLWLVQRGNLLTPEQMNGLLARLGELSHDEERLFEALVSVVPREGDRHQLRRPRKRKRWISPQLGEPEAQVR